VGLSSYLKGSSFSLQLFYYRRQSLRVDARLTQAHANGECLLSQAREDGDLSTTLSSPGAGQTRQHARTSTGKGSTAIGVRRGKRGHQEGRLLTSRSSPVFSTFDISNRADGQKRRKPNVVNDTERDKIMGEASQDVIGERQNLNRDKRNGGGGRDNSVLLLQELYHEAAGAASWCFAVRAGAHACSVVCCMCKLYTASNATRNGIFSAEPCRCERQSEAVEQLGSSHFLLSIASFAAAS